MKFRKTSYLRKTLIPGEEVLLEARLHWVCYLVNWATALLTCGFLALVYISPFFIIFAIICAISFIFNRIKIRGIQMVITDKRVIYKEGIFSTHTQELLNSKVGSITLYQSIPGRIFGYATVGFSGIGARLIEFPRVAEPWKVKQTAEQIAAGENDD